MGPLSAAMGAALGVLLAEALTSIHQASLLHRDFKPGNIILSRDGPMVIDFGLVGLLDEARRSKTLCPDIAYLSDLHPMIEWLTGKVLPMP